MSAVGSILTNSGALSALNSIAQTSQNTNQLQNELASGLSISSPSDNPAGYITAQGFTSQINGLTQATSNANQGVSLLQTAQSAIGQQISVVQQLNSIAVQAANGTQTPSESQSLQELVGQLTGQVSTISNQTQFNNINLLDGSFSSQFQVGANEGQTLGLSINSTSAGSIGMNTSTSVASLYKGTVSSGTAIGSGSGTVTSATPGTAVGGTAGAGLATATAGTISLDGATYTLSTTAGDNTIASVAAGLQNALTAAGKTGVTVGVAGTGSNQTLTFTNNTTSALTITTDNTTTATDLGLSGASTALVAGTLAGAFTTGSVKVTGSNGGSASVNATKAESAASLAQAFNNLSSTSGVQAQATTSIAMSLDTDATSKSFSFTLQAATGSGTSNASAVGGQVKVSATNVSQAINQINATSSTTGIVASEDKTTGDLVIKQTSGQNIAINVSSGAVTPSGAASPEGSPATPTAASFLVQGQVQLQSAGGFSVSGGAAIGLNNGPSSLQSLANMNVTTTPGASKAINIVKYALQGLNNQDGQLGAVQQRMTATINNLTSTSSNATTALGVVQDANIPAVANQLTQAQIQAQSGVAALKSSTQLQQTYLSLLP